MGAFSRSHGKFRGYVPTVIRFRVATFNIRNGLGLDGRHLWWFRRSTTALTIAALDADVIALQEVYRFQQRYLERRLPDYRIVATGRTDRYRGERCPILVRAGLNVVDWHTRWFGATPDHPGTRLKGATFPRIATTAMVSLADPSGGRARPIEVTSTHLDEASADNRLASAAQLVAHLNPDVPRIVMGDLNTDPGSEVIATLREAGFQLVTPDGDGGTEHRFTGRTDGRWIDHILVSPHFQVARAEVVATRLGRLLPSDHWPVVADLDLLPG